MAELPSGTVTFLFTDVEGSTRLLKQLGPGYAELLSEHHRILRSAFVAHGGSEVDNQGDSFFVAFQTAKDAVAAAVDAQRDLFAQVWPAGAEVRVRMGLHTGEPRRGVDRYVGIGVHRAARIGVAGHGGQVLLSSTTKELAEEDLPGGVSIIDLGERRLKDLDQAQHLYQLVIDGLPGAFGPLKTLDVELRRRRRRMYAGAALIGVVAAAVAIPVFALGQGGSSGSMVVGGNAVAIIDPGSNRVSGQVPVGVAPAALAVGGGGLWVANSSDKTVTHIDLASGRFVGNVPLAGDVPLDMAATPNAVWIVSHQPDGAPGLVKIDPHFDTAGPARKLPGSAYGEMGIAVGRGDIWVVSEGGQLDRFDSTGKQVGKPIATDASPSSVAVGAGGIWAADKFGNTVSRIDPETKLSTATPVGNDPTAVAVGAGAVWAADGFDDKVVRIDPATDSVTTSITVGQAPAGIAVGLGSVWVTNSVDGTVSRIDPQTNTVVQTIPVGGSPQAIAVGGGKVWVSVQNALVDPGKQAGLVAHVTDSGDSISSLDPAGPPGPGAGAWEIGYATCAKLFNYPDRVGLAGTRLEPEVAKTIPAPTDGGKTYTFTIRPGFRFSPPSNAPVTAETFKFSIERTLSKTMYSNSNTYYLEDVVGAPAYTAGKAKHISGLSAHGNTLTMRLTHPDPLIPTLLTSPFFCAVPTDTPIVAQGVQTVPAAGPYYVASLHPGQGVVLKRNPNYHGSRPHALDEIDYYLNVDPARSVKDIETGTSDVTDSSIYPAESASLDARYGPHSTAARAGDQRYFTGSSVGVIWLALNTSRPLFKNANLRRAVNYALNRRLIAQAAGQNAWPGPSRPTDQYLPPAIPGYHAIHAYPNTPNLARAKQLAHGHGGKAVFYNCGCPFAHQLAQLVKAELAPIGITVETKYFNFPFTAEGTRGAPFDIGFGAYSADYPDPSDFLALLFDGRTIHATNNLDWSYFNDPAYNRRLDAAAKLSGTRRYRAYQALDAYLTRTAAPGVPLFNGTLPQLFSARIAANCRIQQPIYGIDFAALCLK